MNEPNNENWFECYCLVMDRQFIEDLLYKSFIQVKIERGFLIRRKDGSIRVATEEEGMVSLIREMDERIRVVKKGRA